MNRLIAAAAAAFLLVAPAAQAQSQRAAPAASPAQATPDELRALEQFTATLVEWSNGYVNVLTAHGELLGRLNEGVETALAYHDKRDRRGGAQWGKAWAEQRRAELRSVKEQLGRLDRTPPKAVFNGIDFSADPRIRTMLQRFERLPGLTAQQISSDETLALTIIGSAERTAAGDDNAAIELALAFFDMNSAMLESEARQHQATIEIGMVQDHPQESILRSTIALDRSLALTFRLLKADALEENPDRAAAAAEVRAYARTIAATADELVRRTNASRASVAGLGPVSDPMVQKIEKVMALYVESAETTRQMAAAIEALAVAIEAGPSLDSDTIANAMDAASPVIVAFQDQDMRRRAILAGS